jgi:hypothetical protein
LAFDPDAFLATDKQVPSKNVPRGTFDPDAFLKQPARSPAEAVTVGLGSPQTENRPSDSGSVWKTLYAGLDTLHGPKYDLLDSESPNPKEARAEAVNQSYLQMQMPNLPEGMIAHNWPAVKAQYAKQTFGLTDADIPDTKLYGLIQKQFTEDEKEKVNPWRFRSYTSPTGYVSASQFYAALNKPFKEIPEAPKNLPNWPQYGGLSPAVMGGVWNGAFKPFAESVESPLGVATLAAGGVAAAVAQKGIVAGKIALASINGLFTAIMGYNTVKGAAPTLRVLKDPNASVQDKVTALSGEATNTLMTLAGAVGTAVAVKPEVAKAVEGQTPSQAAENLKTLAAQPDNTLEQQEHIQTAAKELEKVAEPTAPSEAAKAWDEVKSVLAPQTRGPQAQITAGSLREHGADLAQRTDRAAAALDDATTQLMKLAPEKRWGAVDDIENGRPTTDPKLQGFADATRAILDSRRQEIQDLGTGKLEHFIADYFPHIWKDPQKAARAFQEAQAKAPMLGSRAFLKQRTIPTIKEGLALGLEPVTTNPVEMVLLKAREMDKYILGQRWMQEMKDRNFVEYVRSGEQPPDNFEKINDSIATVYGPKTGAVSFGPDVNELTVTPQDVTVHGQRIMGHYYAPSEVARVANNYLSPGLRRFATFRGYLSAANVLNQFQLGFSAFHLGFTSIDTSISKLSVAMEYAAEGKPLKAAGKVAQVPIAPVATILQGRRGMAEWMRPGTQGEEIGKLMDAFRMGGGRAKMDNFYKTNITRRMADMFRQAQTAAKEGRGGEAFLSAGSAAWRFPFAVMEQLSRPMMEYLVPRQKLGVAMDMLRLEMEKLPKDASIEDIRKAAGGVVDSVDNRMGLMTYDNVFWHKAVKDLAMASVRSVGWNLGTIREVGGGIIDTGKFLRNALTPKQTAEFTRRMGYTISLPIITGLIGATYQYLRTGKGPQELRDYFFPKTGEKDPQGRDVRLNLPTYMKDVYHYGHDPVGTVVGKVHPMASMSYEMLRNKDYFDRDIRNADDPLVKQMQEEAKFFVQNASPIGVRQFEQASAAGETTAEKAANFVGVTRAPAWVGETAAEQLAGKLAGDKFKSTKSPDSDLIAQKGRIQVALRTGNEEQKQAAMDALDALVEAEKVTPQQRKNLIKGTEHSYLDNAVSHLDAVEAMRVFQIASPKERLDIGEQVKLKIERAHLPHEDKKALLDKFEQLMASKKVSFNARQPNGGALKVTMDSDKAQDLLEKRLSSLQKLRESLPA